MTDDTTLLRSLAVEAIATIMADAGDGSEARWAAALRAFPDIPPTILASADCRADGIVEERFLAPLRERFADRLAEAVQHPKTRSLIQAARTSHLDADIPF